MRTSIVARLSAICLSIGLAASAAAQEQEGAAPPSSEASAPSGVRLAAGLDYRSFSEYFYFYGYPSGGYSETTGSAAALAGEVAWLRAMGARFSLGGGASLALGSGSADFTTPGPTTTDESIFTAHVEAFGEADYQVASQLALLGRLGLGYTAILHDSADESFTNVFLGLGVHFSVTPRVGIAALYQFNLSELGGTTDAGVTSADPSLESHDNAAFLARLTLRM